MKIHSVRFGHATNSSSSHSIIFAPGLTDDWNGDSEFGWDNFTLASKQAKQAYINQQRAVDRDDDSEGYVDHQSRWGFHDKRLMDDLCEFVMRDGVVVIGGNDNSDGHPLEESYKAFKPQHYNYRHKQRRDPLGYWVFYDEYSGTRVRLSLADTDMDARPEMATWPELVDLKITDYCQHGCAFCYQGSSKTGKHASLASIKRIATMLKEMSVFEVAIGGGEPTEHPKFMEVLRVIKNAGCTPNFTTRNLNWLRGQDVHASLHELVGGIAVSIHSAEEVKSLAKHKEQPIWWKLSAQVIVGGPAFDGDEFKRVLDECSKLHLKLTLLGFKERGRGENYARKNCGSWLSDVLEQNAANVEFNKPFDRGDNWMKQKHLGPVSVDTVLASEYESEIRKAKVPDELFDTKDGVFSMYIDAVTNQCAPSSYSHETAFKPLPKTTDALSEAFRGFFAPVEMKHLMAEYERTQDSKRREQIQSRMVELDRVMGG